MSGEHPGRPSRAELVCAVAVVVWAAVVVVLGAAALWAWVSRGSL